MNNKSSKAQYNLFVIKMQDFSNSQPSYNLIMPKRNKTKPYQTRLNYPQTRPQTVSYTRRTVKIFEWPVNRQTCLELHWADQNASALFAFMSCQDIMSFSGWCRFFLFFSFMFFFLLLFIKYTYTLMCLYILHTTHFFFLYATLCLMIITKTTNHFFITIPHWNNPTNYFPTNNFKTYDNVSKVFNNSTLKYRGLCLFKNEQGKSYFTISYHITFVVHFVLRFLTYFQKTKQVCSL